MARILQESCKNLARIWQESGKHQAMDFILFQLIYYKTLHQFKRKSIEVVHPSKAFQLTTDHTKQPNEVESIHYYLGCIFF